MHHQSRNIYIYIKAVCERGGRGWASVPEFSAKCIYYHWFTQFQKSRRTVWRNIENRFYMRSDALFFSLTLSRSMCTIIASIKSNGAFTQSDYTVCARVHTFTLHNFELSYNRNHYFVPLFIVHREYRTNGIIITGTPAAQFRQHSKRILLLNHLWFCLLFFLVPTWQPFQMIFFGCRWSLSTFFPQCNFLCKADAKWAKNVWNLF